MATEVRATPASADPSSRARPYEASRTRLREKPVMARIPVLGKAGRVMTALGMLILIGMFAAALAAEWTLPALTFVGGFLALLGSTLWMTPNMGPDRDRQHGAVSALRRMTKQNWLLWGVSLVVAGLGGLFFALWYDWLALLG